MTVAALFPSPAEVEAGTPATRVRAIDVIGIVSLVGVVVGHTIMATSTLRPLENSPLTCWDGGFVARPCGRSLAVDVLISLLAARGLASDPQRVCAASLPARMT